VAVGAGSPTAALTEIWFVETSRVAGTLALLLLLLLLELLLLVLLLPRLTMLGPLPPPHPASTIPSPAVPRIRSRQARSRIDCLFSATLHTDI